MQCRGMIREKRLRDNNDLEKKTDEICVFSLYIVKKELQ